MSYSAERNICPLRMAVFKCNTFLMKYILFCIFVGFPSSILEVRNGLLWVPAIRGIMLHACHSGYWLECEPRGTHHCEFCVDLVSPSQGLLLASNSQ